MMQFPQVRPAVRPAVRDALTPDITTPQTVIAGLFAQGQQGFWFPFTDFASLSQDAAGTLPYTALEQPVGRVLDRSGRGNHATQPTSTARPSVTQVGGAPPPWLTFDGVDDRLFVLGMPTIVSGTMVITGVNGILVLEQCQQKATGQVDLTNLPSGILTITGSVYSAIFVEGTIPASTLSAIIGSARQYGCGNKLFTLGAEVLTNTEFATDTTGWAATAPATISRIAGGWMRVTRATSGSFPVATQTVSLTSGKRYLLQAAYNNPASLAIFLSLGGLDQAFLGSAVGGKLFAVATASPATTRVEAGIRSFSGSVSTYLDYGALSCREILESTLP